MKLYVLMAQRKEHYEGQYGLEALACMTQYDNDANPDYLIDEMKKAKNTAEFDSVDVITLDVDEKSIYNVLFPNTNPIKANVV
jgi:hypothetical protein